MTYIANGLFAQFLDVLGISSSTYLMDIILSSFFTAFIIVACICLISFLFKLLCYRK